MELPTTIEECLEALRKERKFDEDPETRIFYSRHLPAVSARVATPRLKEIIAIVRPLPKEALCVPGSPGQDIFFYTEYCKEHPSYSGEFREACLYHANGKMPECFDVEYADRLDDENIDSITVPSSWLVCPAEELRRLVLRQVHNDLRNYVDISKKRLDEVLNALSAFEAKFGAETFAPEIEASKHTVPANPNHNLRRTIDWRLAHEKEA